MAPRTRLPNGQLVGGNPGNSGGKKGRSGRKPDWYKRYAEKLLANKSTKKAMRRILRNPDHPAFRAIVKDLADRAFGRATETLEVSGKLTLEQILARSYEGDDA